MKYSYPAAAAVFFAAAGAAGWGLDGRAAALLGDAPGNPENMAQWGARGLSLRKAAADMKWMEIIQHCGESLYHRDHGKVLAKLADEAVGFDPRFTYVHKFTGAMLMWPCRNPRAAVSLLEKGIRDNPSETGLKLYLAAFTYSRLENLRGEVGMLERLAVAPDAPPVVQKILANVYEKQGRPDKAAAMWRYLAKYSADGDISNWAKGKLERHGMTVPQ